MRASLAFLLVLLSSSSVSAQYLEVRLPVCDPASDEVKIITGPSDWEAINDPRYRIFCVQPGDHSTVSVRLFYGPFFPRRNDLLPWAHVG